MKRHFSTLFQMLTALTLTVMMTPNAGNAQSATDTLQEQVQTISDKVDGLGERLGTAESDLAKLTKIKLSGYIQAQWQWSQDPSAYPANSFLVRRARIKIQYEPISGVVFVLQPDFLQSSVSLKDAYVQINDPWIKTFSLYAGQFNRCDYEVEFSSSQREVPERSRVIRALYPGERGIGAMLQATPANFPLKVQFAVWNGNDGLVITDAAGVDINPKNVDFDNFKDLQARVTYNFKMGNFGSLDVGVNGYYGFLKATTKEVLNSEYQLDKTVSIGNAMKRNWVGAEMQLYMDVLGGMAIKAEYLTGINAFPGSQATATLASPVTSTVSNDSLIMNYLTTTTSTIKPNIERNFMGYYIYLTKNIGKKNQIAFRFDYYDPNTKIKGDQLGVVKYDNSSSSSTTTTTATTGSPAIVQNSITKTETKDTYKSGTADLAYKTLTVAWNYYFNDNIRIMVAYEQPWNEKTGINPKTNVGYVTKDYTVNGNKGVLDYSQAVPAGMFTVRLQAKF
jgi:hypothetical protein